VDELKAGIPLRDWIVQPAPSFFPDGFIVLFLSFLAHDLPRRLALYCFVGCVLLGLGVYATFRATMSRRDALVATTAGCCALFAMSTAARFMQNAYLPGHHGMSLVMLFALLAIASRGLGVDRIRPHKTDVAIVMITGLTLAGDRIFFLHALLPLFVTVVIGGATGIFLWRAAGRTGAAVVVGTIVGFQLSNLPGWFGMYVPPTTSLRDARIEFDRIVAAINAIAPVAKEAQFLPGTIAVFLLVSVTISGACVAPRLWSVEPKPSGPSAPQARHFWPFFATLSASILCAFFGAAGAGFLRDRYTVRYLEPLFVLPPIGLAYAVAALRWPKHRWFGNVWALATIVGSLVVVRRHPAESTIATERATARCLDKVATENTIRYGYADYWSSRKFSLLSHANLRLAHVTAGFRVYPWITNLHWHQQAKARPQPLLVYTLNLNPSRVTAVLGQPSAIEQCGGSDVYIYRTPTPGRPEGPQTTEELR